MAGLVITPGSSISNSYVTAAEADVIAVDLGIDISSWTEPGQSTPYKEMKLIFAADLMGDMFSFRGHKSYIYQRLSFPRTRCQDEFGIALTVIPDEVKMAQVYLAIDIIPRYMEQRGVTNQFPLDELGAISSFTMRDVTVNFQQKYWTSTDVVEYFVNNRHTLLFSLLSRYIAQIKIADGRWQAKLPAVEGQPTSSTTTTTTTSTTSTSTTTTSTTASTTTTS